MIKIEFATEEEEWFNSNPVCDHCEKVISIKLEYIQILGEDGGLYVHKKCIKSLVKEINNFIEDNKKKALIKKIAGI